MHFSDLKLKKVILLISKIRAYEEDFITPLMPESAKHKLPTLTSMLNLYPLYNQFKKNNYEIIPEIYS